MGTLFEKVKDRTPLLPDHHPERDFFLCDLFDAVPKSDTASMEHPLFTLSTRPDMTVKEYKNGDQWLKLSPSPLGLATVHDRDILIYCISQCMKQLNAGKKIHRTLLFNTHDLLKVTNRPTNNLGYERFKNAIKRLQGTQIETNITTGGTEQWEIFSFIESTKIIKESREGRMHALEITLSDWVFNAIKEKGGEILTISRDYFRLRKPLERRLYELARKMCGQSAKWHLRIETIHKRTGSASTLKEFKRMVKQIINDNYKHNHIPDYTFELRENLVIIRPRKDFTESYSEAETPSSIDKIILQPTTYKTVQSIANGLDYRFLENEWRHMLIEKNGVPENPDGSFIGFVKWYTKSNP